MRPYGCSTHPSGGHEDCDDCKKNFEKSSSYCRCGQEVTNAAFFKKTSPHFKGTCIPWGTPKPWKVPERTIDKPMPYPMPKMPDYSLSKYPQSLEEFYKYWGVKPIGNGLETAETWILNHPEIAYANTLAIEQKIKALELEQKRLKKKLEKRAA